MNPGFLDYQTRAREFAVYDKGIDEFIANASQDELRMMCRLLYAGLGLCSEAGEVAGKMKKLLRDKAGVLDQEARQGIAGEVGDTQWYLADICTLLGKHLGVVAQENIQKLRERKAADKLKGDGDNR